MKPLSQALALISASLSVLSAACEHKIEFDPRYSYNVIQVPDWYPEKQKPISPAQQEVLQRRGRPEYFRFWWNRDGHFIRSSDLSGKSDKIDEIVRTTKYSWVYLREPAAEIEFNSEGGYLVHPVTEQLALICEDGDPTTKEPPRPDEKGRMKESWRWIDVGVQIEFLDGKEITRSYFPGSGKGTVPK